MGRHGGGWRNRNVNVDKTSSVNSEHTLLLISIDREHRYKLKHEGTLDLLIPGMHTLLESSAMRGDNAYRILCRQSAENDGGPWRFRSMSGGTPPNRTSD